MYGMHQTDDAKRKSLLVLFSFGIITKAPSPLSSFDVDAAGRKHGLCLLSEQHDALVTPSGGYIQTVFT